MLDILCRNDFRKCSNEHNGLMTDFNDTDDFNNIIKIGNWIKQYLILSK